MDPLDSDQPEAFLTFSQWPPEVQEKHFQKTGNVILGPLEAISEESLEATDVQFHSPPEKRPLRLLGAFLSPMEAGHSIHRT